MDNQKFLETLDVPAANQQKCLEAMAVYEDNHWWEPDVDPRRFAYLKIRESILLSSFSHFHESIELLLGRPVYTHEFGISHDKLVQEAERAWKYQVGVTSEAERQERVQESLDDLRAWAKENNKQVIDVQLSDE